MIAQSEWTLLKVFTGRGAYEDRTLVLHGAGRDPGPTNELASEALPDVIEGA